MRNLNALLVTLIRAGTVSGCVVYTRPGPYHYGHPCYRCY